MLISRRTRYSFRLCPRRETDGPERRIVMCPFTAVSPLARLRYKHTSTRLTRRGRTISVHDADSGGQMGRCGSASR